MRQHAITFGFLALAIACYALGAAGPGMIFLALGVLPEGVFWYRLCFRGGRK